MKQFNPELRGKPPPWDLASIEAELFLTQRLIISGGKTQSLTVNEVGASSMFTIYLL